jgi:DNA-binding NtrC family response regulator
LHTLTIAQHRTPVPRRVRLEVISGPASGVQRDFEGRIRIGARPIADLVLVDPKISGLHCELIAGEELRLRDLGSKNGTFLGGYRIVEAVVPSGAAFVVGDSRIRALPLELEDAPLAASPADARHGLLGSSRAMKVLRQQIDDLASHEATVLIQGETGTGKELIAEGIHESGARRSGPLVIVDCGAIVPTLLEASLFGYERGAFTDANARSIGAFERAHGGTLFLDEIGELPPDLQPKLLRAIESRTVKRLGGDRPIRVDVRIIAATHRDLALEVAQGRFREDLYYRVAVVRLSVPPLRERLEDVPILAAHFLRQAGGDPAVLLGAHALVGLARHAWPGNVRELRNVLEEAVALKRPVAIAAPVREGFIEWMRGVIDLDDSMRVGKQRIIDCYERVYVTRLLEVCGGNVSEVARRSGMNRMSIQRIMTRLGLVA